MAATKRRALAWGLAAPAALTLVMMARGPTPDARAAADVRSAEIMHDFAVDAGGEVVVAGKFFGTVDFGGQTATTAGSGIFVARYRRAGELAWLKAFGGGSYDEATAVRIDGAGNITVAGNFEDHTSVDGIDLRGAGGRDVFVLRLTREGRIVWARTIGGPGWERADALVLAPDGLPIVGGQFSDKVAFGAAGTLATTDKSGDLFVTKLSAAGEPMWVKRFGGDRDEQLALAVSGQRIAMAVSFRGTADFGAGPWTAAHGQFESALAILSGDGRLVSVKHVAAGVAHLAVAPGGDLYIDAGAATDFHLDGTMVHTDPCAPMTTVVARLSPEGRLRWARVLAHDALADSSTLVVAPNGDVIVASDDPDAGQENGDGDVGEHDDAGAGAGDGVPRIAAVAFTPDGAALFGDPPRAGGAARPIVAGVSGAGRLYVKLAERRTLGQAAPGLFVKVIKSGDTAAVLSLAELRGEVKRRQKEARRAALRFPWLPDAPSSVETADKRELSLGDALAFVGDVNGDGFGDLAVAAGSARRVSVYLGGTNGLRPKPVDLHLPRGDGSRIVVAPAGDVNGDGFADVAVAAPGLKGHPDTIAVFLGSKAGVAADPAWTRSEGTGNDRLGAALAAGDLNGDGFGDLAAGAPDAGDSSGKVYVYLGGKNGLGAAAAWTAAGSKAAVHFGAALAACDLDGDGKTDLAIVEQGGETDTAEGHGYRNGAVAIHFGGAGGPAAQAAWRYREPARSISMLDSVACAGDADGDGRNDLLVGSSAEELDGSHGGRAYLFTRVAPGPARAPAWTGAMQTGSDRVDVRVAALGDVNGDGLADLLVGATSQQTSNGRVAIFLGRKGKPAGRADWTVRGQGAFGSVLAAGDFNGDHLPDVAAGAPASAECVKKTPRPGYNAQIDRITRGQVQLFLSRPR